MHIRTSAFIGLFMGLLWEGNDARVGHGENNDCKPAVGWRRCHEPNTRNMNTASVKNDCITSFHSFIHPFKRQTSLVTSMQCVRS